METADRVVGVDTVAGPRLPVVAPGFDKREHVAVRPCEVQAVLAETGFRS